MKMIGPRIRLRSALLASMLVVISTSAQTAGTDADRVELSKIGISNQDNGTIFNGGLTAEGAQEMLAEQERLNREMVRSQLCDQPPKNELCATLPNDNTDFSALFVYIFLSAAAQNSFDIFSWQSFIALNWPVNDAGIPLKALNHSAGHKPQWADYITPAEIFAPDQPQSICDNGEHNEYTLTTSNYIQPTGQPLIDQNLNYVVYDVRVNSIMAEYLRENGLDTLAGQEKFADDNKIYDFPVGHYADPETKQGGHPGSIAVKTAWKVIDETSDDDSRFFTVNGQIAVPASNSETGDDLCIEAKLGLVGMHIMRRTDSGNGREWIWSTFEHVDNAPLAVNSRRPNDILHDNPFAQGCIGPETTETQHSFYNASCVDCQTNAMQPALWTWSSVAPYTGSYASSGGKPTQVVQCWDVFDGTKLINNEWRQQLANTVWANYRSVSAQWKGANRGKMVPEGEVPRFMTNTTMETYEQHTPRGSCLSCHAGASSVAGQSTAFSFIPGLISRYQ